MTSPASTSHRIKALSPDELEAACQMSVRGVDCATIAQALASTPRRVEVALKKRSTRQRLEQIRGEVVRREVEHYFALHNLLPGSAPTLADVMGRGTAKARGDIARWLHDMLIGRPSEKSELHVSGRLEHDLSPVLGQIQQHLVAIREANAGRDPLARVRQGDEVLVRPMLPSGTEE